MKAKNLLFLPLLGLSMVFFVQCAEDPFYSETDDPADISALKKGKGGGGHPDVFTNNLSFPAIAVDNFLISKIAEADHTFLVPYEGDYPGLSPEQIAALGDDDWFAQKTEGNLWQAEWMSKDEVTVTFIDWGDVIESVNPKLRRPFRLEVTLYKNLTGSMMAGPMDAYKMALLEYPSSKNEVQGTNATTYKQAYATVVSGEPTLVVQYLGDLDHDELYWDVDRWKIEDGTGGVTVPDVIPVTFSTELNVGGKYIYGASKGGWKPTQTGYFRITFYVPAGSGVYFNENTEIGNAADFVTTSGGSAIAMAESDEGGAAIPHVVHEDDLTYVDVLVVAGGGGGGGKKRR